MQFIIYFVVGVLQDFLVTLNFRFTAKEKAFPASLISFLSTLIFFLVLYNVLTKLDQERSIIAIVVYAAGIATGTFLGIKNKFWMKDK